MRLLIVEDEPTLGRQLKSTLEGAGYAVDLATDGEDGHFLGSTENYDAVVLDLGLPEIDGLTVLDRWRKEGRDTPVLVLTARDSWSDKVAGLDAGADDYLAKPFQSEELIARLRALIRRSSGNASSELIAGDVRLDTRSGKVTLAGEPVKLTARDSWSDKVAGLDAGADDYLAKPFQSEELIARLRALIRRSSGNASSELTAGDVRLDTRSGKVTLNGEPVKLTAQEYKLLSYLMHHKGKVVSRTELIEHIYDQDFDRDSNTIEVFVTRIRKKLGADVISTIRGLGYSLDEPAG